MTKETRRRLRAPEGVLVRETRRLLKEGKRSHLAISLETGLPENWLWRFSAGRMTDPSVNRVERLYTCLTGRALELPQHDA